MLSTMGLGVFMKAEKDTNKTEAKINEHCWPLRAYNLVGDVIYMHEKALKQCYK